MIAAKNGHSKIVRNLLIVVKICDVSFLSTHVMFVCIYVYMCVCVCMCVYVCVCVSVCVYEYLCEYVCL